MLFSFATHDVYERDKAENETYDEFARRHLGVSADVVSIIMQEGDTGIGGAILDEYWDNIPHSSFCTNWGNATKEQLGYAVKELHRIYVADMSAAAASTSKSKINYVSDYY